MKTLILFTFSFITLVMVSNAQTVVPPGDVSGTWTLSGSPYQIQGEISIPFLEILTIEPGVLIEFQGHYKLNVYGRLLAVGTETDTITFTIKDTTGFHNPNIPDGGWAGIRFTNVFSIYDSSKITFCKIEYGKALGSWPDGTGGAICVAGFDNLTISNCLITNNIANVIDGGGGGIALWNSNPTISNSTMSNNLARFGGGIQCYESSPLIENNLLLNNNAEQGGGIVCNEYAGPSILNTIIENNTAEAGGGIVCWNYSSPILNGVTFRNNTATNWAGGAISTSNVNLQIDNCIFEENNTAQAGGAISLWCGDTLNITYQLSMTNTLFHNNSAEIGGGIFVGCGDSVKVDVFIDKCSFTNNFARICGGLLLLGGMKKVDFTLSNSIFSDNKALEVAAGCDFGECSGTVSNCLFNSNVASTGGGNWGSGGLGVWSNSNVDIMNCTFADNTAAYGAGLGVGMGSIVTTTNCIFWGNNTDQIALGDTLSALGSTLTVNYCDIRGGEDSINVIDPLLSTLNWGDGNIDEDPDFENPENGDYDLQNSSPCIGAGITAIQIGGIWHFCPADDIEGNPRPNPPGSMPDIGAYESPLAVSGIGTDFNKIPKDYSIFQNYPNPFNPLTKIKYSIPQLSNVVIKVFDILGNEIETLVNEEKTAGIYELTWNADNLSSGVYFYQLKAGTYIDAKKMVLMK